MMRIHLNRDVERLKRQFLALGAEVEEDVHTAVRAVEERDPKLAEEVLDRENRVNEIEVDVEEECLKVLALHQPVAGDLRYIVSVMKINSDLERIGDLAEHIAERAIAMCGQPRVEVPLRLGEMAEKAQNMLRQILDAFVNLDTASAHAICAADSEVDEINLVISKQVKEMMARNPSQIEPLLQILHIARHLERIADHATNIGEDLIYLVEGKIVRHKTAAALARQPIRNGSAKAG